MTGISAEQAWSDKAFNPGNVPRQVPTRLQRFMPLEPITLKQENALNDLIAYMGIGPATLRTLFGEGFVAVNRLSSWAASWAITTIRSYEDRPADTETALKAHIADHYRARHPELRRVTVDD